MPPPDYVPCIHVFCSLVHFHASFFPFAYPLGAPAIHVKIHLSVSFAYIHLSIDLNTSASSSTISSVG